MFDLSPFVPLIPYLLLGLVILFAVVIVYQQNLLQAANEDCTYAWQREQAAREQLERERLDRRLMAAQYEILARAERRNANS